MACSICNDTGWKRVDKHRVARCECQTSASQGALLATAQIPLRYADCNLDRFIPPEDDDGTIARARDVAAAYITSYEKNKRGLMFVGGIGLGKTHLAVAVLRGLVSKGFHCRFRDYRELLKEIQNSYNPEVRTTELGLLEPLFEVDVLLIDELGAVRASEWVWDTVSLLINSRYNDKKTTILTTNFANTPSSQASDQPLSPEQKTMRKDTLGDRIGDRMLSRVNEMCAVITLYGQDYRRRKHANPPVFSLKQRKTQP